MAIVEMNILPTRARWESLAGSLVLATILLASLGRAQELPSPEDFFETRIRPVLIEHCDACHSRSSEILQANLRLDSPAGWRLGGDSGPAIVPGDPDGSLLMQALSYETLQMPPRGKLPESVLEDFRTWIARGAFDPRTEEPIAPSRTHFDSAAVESHWAFQPLRSSPVPSMPTGVEGNHPIDAWVATAMPELGWLPAPIASESVLLRRVHFALTGLPPTPEEIDAFFADPERERYDRLVDRLLASPQYGVRWGRHWLDLVRYADSNGADENHEMPNAWRYRDWVVWAFNEDLPFDAFVAQQLAGDLLPEPESEIDRGRQIAATGFWVLGPKMLAEQDKAKMRIDIVDEQIDTLSRSLFGLTLSCARCHDHKFDPITQEDYFALAGILFSTRSMANEDFVSKWMERPLPSQSIEAARAEHQAKIEAARSELERASEEARANLAQRLAELQKSMPEFEMAMAVEEASPTSLAVHVRGNHLQSSGDPVPRGIPAILQRCLPMEPIEPNNSGRLQLARWLIHPDNPLLARVMVNRIWMWHFGQGLVASPSNFGLRGESPTHPELLDALAREWIDRGWSMKWLHRQILLSNVYRRSSEAPMHPTSDPDNRWLWRQNVRRLEAEPLRDAILFCSGGLDLRLGGPGGDLSRARRTLYASLNRAALPDYFSTFDYVDPASPIEQRPVTSVPSQALFFMNSEVVGNSAEGLAEQLEMHSHDRAQQIEQAYRVVMARGPTPLELDRCRDLLVRVQDLRRDGEGPDSHRALEALVQALMASREFSWIE